MGPQRVDKSLYDYFLQVEKSQESQEGIEDHIRKIPEDKLKKLINNIKDNGPTAKIIQTTGYKRNQYISYYAKMIANGKCQLCNNDAPFYDKNGYPYLESHHITWLSEGGDDALNNVVALCPNCHRRMHIVNDPKDKMYLQQVAEKN